MWPTRGDAEVTAPKDRPVVALVMIPGLESQVLGAAEWERLRAAARLVSDTAYARPEDIDSEVAADVQVLLTGWGCPNIGADAVARLPNLRLVAHSAGTVKTMVSDELYLTGAHVTSAADANAIPVTEFTVAAVVMVSKQVFAIRDRHRTARGMSWGAFEFPKFGNHGKTIGLVGASRIGRLVAEGLQRFDAELLISDPFLDEAGAAELGAAKVELDELCRRSDIVSLHAPDLPSTRHMIGAEQLALMSDGAWLINTARGGLVDHEALTTELVNGRIGAFLDTTDPEPLPDSSPLYDLENVVLTPHIAGSLGNEIARMGGAAVTEIERFAAGLPPAHPVHQADLDHIA
jgi:phosphoglycerate dehydrogenase-like enzyme